jgi:GT2 family glycosyltransferase/glycosyltransferase involved in cell wall biosynthesis
MLGRLVRIFARYADQSLRLTAPGCELRDREGRAFGRIDRLEVVRNRLVVEGWTAAARIGLALNRIVVWTTPDLARPGGSERGFTLDLPFEPGPCRVLAEMPGGGGRLEARLPGFSPGRVARARALLWLPYLGAVAGLLPQIWRLKRHGDPVAREAIKERLRLVPASDAVEISAAAVLGPAAAPAPVPASVTIVMPVFNALSLVREALARVMRHTGEGLADWRLIVIEDASTDPALRPWLVAWAAEPAQAGRVRLVLNDANLGFVAAANRGLEAARAWPDDPVILLNSDAMVPPGWAARLVAPLADPDVASATPLSNDAEILTVPVICRPAPLPEGAGDRLDAAARALPAAGAVALPTGVGFCMALSPRFLARLPAFDAAFGRGYGEETDWCQRARALGGRHVAVPNLFVEHRGGASFGQAGKQARMAASAELIARRYPAYDREVQDFIRADPLAAQRLALGLAWAAERAGSDPVPVYLGHAMGGGAELDLERRIRVDLDRGPGAAVVLRVGQGRRWRIELCTPQGRVQGLTGDEALMRALLARLPRRRVVYSCGVGDPDPLALPGLLLDLAGRERPGASPLPGGRQPLEVLLHDYFVISPSYTLLGADGAFRGVPRPGTPAGGDPAHQAAPPGAGRAVTLADWQAAWGALIAAADRITAFSRSSRDLLAEVWPAAAARVAVDPHRLPAAVPRIPAGRGSDGRPVIGVLGNIGAHKGAGVLQEMARALARSRRAGLVVIGRIDPAFPLAAPARVHGSYELRDLPALVQRYGISAWFIPSVWPETFSFTTHEALATGMPVFCFDLGAQAEALRAALARGAAGGVLPLPPRGDMALEVILAGLEAGRCGDAA